MNLLDARTGQTLANDLEWLNEPPKWTVDEGGLTVVPGARTDFFRPYEGAARDTACLLYREVTGDFTAAAGVSVHTVGFGDAAAVVARASESQWAKLCLERSPIGELSAVSVVTDGYSDDANNELLPGSEGFLRLTRKGNVFGMHYSLAGAKWRFVRTFPLEMPAAVMVGISAQAPFTDGCRALFTSFTVSPEPVADFRSGE